MTEKSREQRLRRNLKKDGYCLKKARNQTEFLQNTYMITELETRFIVYADWNSNAGYGLSLKECEEWAGMV